MVHVTRSGDEIVVSVAFSGDDGTVGKSCYESAHIIS